MTVPNLKLFYAQMLSAIVDSIQTTLCHSNATSMYQIMDIMDDLPYSYNNAFKDDWLATKYDTPTVDSYDGFKEAFMDLDTKTSEKKAKMLEYFVRNLAPSPVWDTQYCKNLFQIIHEYNGSWCEAATAFCVICDEPLTIDSFFIECSDQEEDKVYLPDFIDMLVLHIIVYTAAKPFLQDIQSDCDTDSEE